MGEVLVQAMPNREHDSDLMATQRLDIQCIKPDGWSWTEAELGPGSEYIVVKVPDRTVAQLQHLNASWLLKPLFRRLTLDEPADVLEIEVSAEQQHADGRGGVAGEQFDEMVTQWNCAEMRPGDHRPVIRVPVAQAGLSHCFSGCIVGNAGREVSYRDGIHVLEIDAARIDLVTDPGVSKAARVLSLVSDNGRNPLRSSKIITYEVDRDLIEATMLSDFRDRLSHHVGQRRFGVSSSLLTMAALNGGSVTVSGDSLESETRDWVDGGRG